MNDVVEKRKTAGKGSSGTQLLDKALNMVELVANTNQRLTAHDIAMHTGYSKPTTYRILAALVRRSMLTLDERDQAYELGLRFSELTTSLRASHRFLMLIERDLIDLSARTGETVSVGIAEKDSVRIVSRYTLGFEVRQGATSGSKRPFHASGIGKAALAWVPDDELPQYLRRINYQALTPKTLADVDALEEELRLTRARGYAIDDEEIIEGVRCVARPLLTRHAELIGAISLSAPAYRMPPQRVRDIAIALGKIATSLRERLNTPEQHLAVSTSRLRCLHEGGLFRPIAIGRHGENLVIVDALAPAVHLFTADNALRQTFPLSILPSAAAVSDQGRVVLAHGQTLWEWHADAPIEIGSYASEIIDVAFDDSAVLVALAGEQPVIIDAQTRKRRLTPSDAPQRIHAHRGLLVCASAQGTRLDIYRLDNGKRLVRLMQDNAEGELTALALHDGQLLLAYEEAWYLRKLSIDTGQVDYLMMPERLVTAMGYLDDAFYLAGSNLDAVLDDNASMPGSLYRLEQPWG